MEETMRKWGLTAVAALLAAQLWAGSTPAQAEDITLQFTVWNYSLDTIQDNARKFEEQNPGIKVKVTDYTWTDYQDSLVLRFRSGTQTDVVYGGQDWLPAWAAAGWVVPLDDVAPDKIGAYKPQFAPFTLSDMTYKGKLYGLPYYADTISLVYNKKILADNGIAVPQTWDDLLQACLKLKEKGMETPISYEYNQELPNFFDAFVAQVYGRGGDLFDKDGKALFADPQNAAYQQLQWLQDAFSKYKLVDMEVHESKVIPAMNTGKHAFTVVYNYVLAAMNSTADQPLAGQFALAPMPGATHGTLGFTKFYAMTAQAAKDPARREAAWKFIDFMAGGDYHVAKRWAVEKGLGFGQLPLFKDPDIQTAWSKWVDMKVLEQQVATARGGTWKEWTAVWSAYFRPLLAKAMVGQASVDETMKAGAAKWEEYRAAMGQN
jgi:multiple sugar transport system substrate-binding protein